MTEFRWRVVVLDDKAHTLSSDALEKRGLNVRMFGKAELGEQDTVNELRVAHVALVDMQWLGFAQAGEVVPIPSGPPTNLVEFAKKWIGAIETWSSTSAPLEYDWGGKTPCPWPRSAIDANDIGIWLTALLSHLNPDLEAVLYSGTRVGWSSQLAALGRFRDAAFEVVPKPNTDAMIDFGAILPALRRVQARYIEKNNDFRHWFIGSVLVPVILGTPPLDGEFRDLLADGTTQGVRLKHAIAFPQLAVEDKSIDELRELLPKSRLLPKHRLALEVFLHDLKETHLQSLTNVEAAKKYAERFQPYCLDAGDIGAALSRALANASGGTGLDDVKAGLRMVWCDAFSRVFSAHYAIADLCQEFAGTYADANGSRPQWADLSKPGFRERETQTHYRGEVAALRALAAALNDNALTYGDADTVYSLSATESENELLLSWTDTSRGFADHPSFAGAVIASARRKGVHRGLPSVLSAAIRLGATSISVALGPCGSRKWRQVFPTQQDEDSIKTSWTFGIRIRLQRPSGAHE